ncbi:glycosyltransferase [Streptomyces sp. NPDC048664]|uniref:glycosyltransferase n=1 Tax=Streptomyces sp. NPDC048664 TaxID=3154505 RepID=UPI0034437170
MRIGLITEGGHPYVSGDAGLWYDRLVRGLGQHEFDVYALGRTGRQEAGGAVPPSGARRVRTAPLWTAGADGAALGRRARRRFGEAYGELAAVLCAVPEPVRSPGTSSAPEPADPEADRFRSALYALAELARDEGALAGALRSETALRALEKACRAPRAPRAARVSELLDIAVQVERALRPLSLDWYEDDALGAVDLCHATTGGAPALTGLLARHFTGVPLLVTEYGAQLRAHYLGTPGGPEAGSPVRALLASLHRRIAAEVYRTAACVTPGNAHTRRWQERCGADRSRSRTVHPGLEASRFAEVGESPDRSDPHTLLWVGRVEPGKDLVCLLHAFTRIRAQVPRARLRLVGAPADAAGRAYLGHCKALAAQLFPDEAEGVHDVGDNPVSFEESGGPGAPDLADVYAAGAVVVLSSVAEGFPTGLVEAMLCGRATVSTDTGAVLEVIGGTGLVVPPRNPRALARACVALLKDPERRARLGAAARARALELFTVEQNIEAFRGIYLEIVSRTPVRRVLVDDAGAPLPFGAPAESHVPGLWARTRAPGGRPRWAWAPRETATAPVRATGRSQKPVTVAEGAG